MTYKIDSFVNKIKNPIICLFEDNQIEFRNGVEASEYDFKKYYLIDSIYINEEKIVMQLVENKNINSINWVGEEAISIFD